MNALTSGWVETAKMSVFLPDDRMAISTALRIYGPVDPCEAKVVRIKNTQMLERFWISESLCVVIRADTELQRKLEIVGEPREMQFDVLGGLASFGTKN